MKSHVWGYGHLAVWAGVAATSVGIEFAILEVTEPATLNVGPRAALCGGVALYLIAIGAIQGATPSSLAATVLTARLAVAAFALVLAPVGAFLSRLALVGLLVLALVALTVFEANGSQRRAGDAEEPAP